MSVISKLRDFLYRHRNKIVVGGVILSGSILLTKYAQQKLKEWEEREAKEFLEKTRKHKHFESTERTCNQTIVNLVATLNTTLSNNLNTQDIISELRNNPDNKVELWEKLKVLVFNRVCILIYMSVMLVVTLRIQLNILGGYLYKDSQSISTEIQENYLSLCQNLLENGMQKLSIVLETECYNVLKSIPLTQQLSIDDIENLFWTIQTSLKNSNIDPVGKLREYLIENTENMTFHENMIQDTIDLLESDEVKNLTSSTISNGFAVVGDQIAQYYRPKTKRMIGLSTDSVADSFIHPDRIRIPLAKLIPIINGLFCKDSLPNVFIQQLIINEKLKTLGANVYETFSYT